MSIPEQVYEKGIRALQFNQELGIGSHLQAGARAQLIDSPLTKALSSRRGRMLARTMQYLFRGNIEALMNYAIMRPYAELEAIKIALGDQPEHKIVVDPASGLSPVFYWLAEKYPNTQFVEIDAHEVIEFKRGVYYEFGVPANLRLRPVDLKDQLLHTVLNERADVIVALGAYVSHDEYRDMLAYLTHVLRDGGYIIATFPYSKGIDNFTDNSFVFSNIVSTPKGAIRGEADFEVIFKDTDFSVKKVIKLSELAKELGKPEPADIEMIAVAQYSARRT